MSQNSPSEDPTLMERLECIQKLPLKPSYKVDLALIVLGEKPSTEIIFFYPPNCRERASDMEQKLIDVGLEVAVGDEKTRTDEENLPVEFGANGQIITMNCYQTFYVANSTDDANTLRELGEKYFHTDTEIPPQDHRTFGHLFGFPESAIEGFIQGQTIKMEDLPDDIRRADYGLLLQFLLSKNNWQNEIKTVKRWYQVLYKNAPALLDEYLKYVKALYEERERRIKAMG